MWVVFQRRRGKGMQGAGPRVTVHGEAEHADGEHAVRDAGEDDRPLFAQYRPLSLEDQTHREIAHEG